MKAYRGEEVEQHSFLPRHYRKVSGQPHAPTALPPRQTVLAAHWTGAWVGPGDGLDVLRRVKSFDPARIWTPGRPARSLVATYVTLAPFPKSAPL